MTSTKITHYGKVTDTIEPKLVYNDEEFFKWDLASFKGKTVEVQIKPIKITRSLLMNAYLWGVVYRLAVERFNELCSFDRTVDAEFVHSFFKGLLFGVDKVSAFGWTVEVEATTTNMDNQEFITFFEFIIKWCAETIDIEIPLPNEKLNDFLQTETSKS